MVVTGQQKLVQAFYANSAFNQDHNPMRLVLLLFSFYT